MRACARAERRSRPWHGALATWLAALAVAVTSAAWAQESAFPNQGFENGLTHWSSVDVTVQEGPEVISGWCYPVVSAPSPVTWTVEPFAVGNRMARLFPRNTIRGATGGGGHASAWDQLGLSQASRTYLNGIFPNSTDYAIVYRDLALLEGDTFAMAWNYVATDYAPFNDGSFVTLVNVNDPSAPLPLINGLVGDLQSLGVTMHTTPPSGTYVTGDCGTTGWQTTTFEVRASGTYRLGFAAFNLSDTAYPPIVFVDEAAGITRAGGEIFDPIPPAPNPPPPQIQPDAGVTTGAVSGVTATTASVAGAVTAIGTGPLTQHGHVWSTATNPAVNLPTKTEFGGLASPASFSSSLTGLEPETTYHVRAYATNANGTSYGSVVTFTTASGVVCEPAGVPTSLSVTGIGTDAATLSWSAPAGSEPITYQWSVRRAADAVLTASGSTASTSATATALAPGTGYVASVLASNCGGDSAAATSGTFTTLRLAQAAVSGALASGTITYGADTTTVTASGGSGSGAYEFRQQGGTGSVSFAGTGASRTLTGTSAGSAPIEVRRLGDATYLDSPWVSAGTLTIAQAPLQVVAQDAGKVYGDPEPDLSYEVTGTLYFGDTAAVVSGVTLSTATGAAATAGTHAIVASGGSAANYAITHVPGTLTVAARPVTVTADDVGKEYAEPAAADPELTWAVTAGTLAYADTLASVFSGAPTRASGEAVGAYAIGQGSLAADANYALTFVGGTLAIRHGPADHLVTVAPPGPQTAGLPFALVSVTAVDRYGNVADGAHGATAYEGAKTLGYALSGLAGGPTHGDDAYTTAVTFAGGVATTPLVTTLHRAQVTTITALAADLATPVVADVASAPFEVLAAPVTHLAFVVQPVDTRAATPFAAPPTVALRDAFGNVVVDAAGIVSFDLVGAASALEPGSGSTVPIELGLARLPCSWVDAPARGVALRATSAGLGFITSVPFDVTGALVSGVAYVDATASGQRAADAVGIPLAIVTLADANGPVSWPDGGEVVGDTCHARMRDAAVTDSAGRFALPGLDAGSYTLAVSGEAVAGMVRMGRDPLSIAAPAFGRHEGADVGFFPGAIVEGSVHRDDGAGAGGVPGDAVRQSGERGLAGVTLRATAGSNPQVSMISGADGAYRLALPLTGSAAHAVSVSHTASRASGHRREDDGGDLVTLRAGTAGDAASFSVTAGDVVRLDFAVVPPLRLSGAGAAVVGSPGVARFALTLEPGTPGLVVLTGDPNRYAWTLQPHPDDAPCAVLTTSAVGAGAWLVEGPWPRDPADQRPLACRWLVDVHVPAGEPAGRVDDLTLRASMSWSRPDGAPSVADPAAPVVLRTAVVEGGRVVLAFEASSDGGLSYHESVAAPPGWPVRYRIRFANTGAEAVQALVVRLPIADAYAVPLAASALDAELRCPGAADPVVVALPYDAVTRSLALDLAAANTCGLDHLAPGASGELTLTLEIR